MVDITGVTSFADSSPEQAASNIQNAAIVGINPVPDKDLNNKMSNLVGIAQRPKQATPAVADYMSQSTEHAALAQPDVDKHGFIDEIAKYIGDIVYNRPTDDQKLVELSNKKMSNGGNLSPEDQYQLWQLNQDRAAKAKDDYNDPPSLPSRVGQALLDTGRVLRRNADLIAGATAVGAGTGLAGGPFAEVTVPGGAAAGFGYGVTAAFVKDGYQSAMGATYNELSNLTKDDGTPLKIDEQTKANVSRGVGIISGAVNGILGHKLVDTAPWLSKLVSPKMAKNLILNPVNAALLKTVTNVGETFATGYGAGASVEAAKIIAEEMGKTYDGSQASFTNALEAAAAKGKENLSRMNEAGIVSGTSAAAIASATGVATFGRTRAGFEQRSAETLNAMSQRAAETRDVTPDAPLQLQGPRDVTPANPDVGPEVGPSAPENKIQQSAKVLQLRDGLEDMSTVAQQTKMHELAPGEMSSMMRGIFNRAGITKLYTSLQSLRNFSATPEQGKAARNLLDPSGEFAGQMNAPIEVDPSKVIEIAHDHPEILDHVQVDPTGPTAGQAKQYLEGLQQAEVRRQALFEKLGIKPADVQPEPQSNVTPMPAPKDKAEAVPFDLEAATRRTSEILGQLQDGGIKTPEKAKLQTELDGIKQQVADHFKSQRGDLLVAPDAWPEPGQDQSREVASNYVNAPTFTEAIQKVLPKAEVQKYNIAQQNARKSVVDTIHEAALHEMAHVQDPLVEAAKEARLEEEQARIANDPNYAVIDKIRDARQSAKANKTPSVYAIDPRTLTKEQLKYADHFRLKEHKVFDKKGGTADSAALLLGVKDGNELLHILAKTPTREEVAQARAKAFEVSDANELLNNDNLNHTKVIEHLRDQTKNHIAEMTFMREQEWPATKAGIKRIALPLPKIEELTLRAKQQVGQTKINSLNANQYLVGESRSQRAAVNSILKNQVEKAFSEKENAAMNSEMAKETMLATAKVNRALRFARRFNKKSTQQVLQDAGKLYVNAANEILSLFNLTPSRTSQADIGSFQKWAKQEYEAGRGDFSVPERLSDIRQNVHELTVEQLEVLTDRLGSILHQARFKTKLLNLQAERTGEVETQDTERFSKEATDRLADHPGNSERKLSSTRGNPTAVDKALRVVAGIENLLTAKQFIYRELDRGMPGGWFQRNFDDEMEGAGEYFEKSGFTKKKKMLRELKQNVEKIVKEHGDFKSLEKNFVQIPEFEKIPELNNGYLTKGDLAMAWAYRGDPYTRQKLFDNTGNVSAESWQKIFDRYLTKKDYRAIQALVDLYKGYRPEVEALQKRQGEQVDFIDGAPNRGGEFDYEGGWVRARYRHDYVKSRAEKLDFSNMSDFQPAAEMTDQGYLKTRTGSKDPLDLSLRGLFLGHVEVIQDLSYREPLQNFQKKITDPDTKASIIKAVGDQKYNTLIDVNLEIGNQLASESEYFLDANRVIKSMLNRLGNNFAITALAFNPSTPLIQFESLTEMGKALGPKSGVHFAAVNAELIKNMGNAKGFIDAAMALDPNIEKYFTRVQDRALSAVDKLVPKKAPYSKSKLGNQVLGTANKYVARPLEKVMELGTMAGFGAITAVDAYLKIAQALTVYRMFRAGDFPGVSKEDVAAMSPEELHQRAQSAVQHMSSLTQIQNRRELQAPIQKNPAMAGFTFFWNYLRNVTNNLINDGRRTRWKTDEAWDKIEEGDTKGATKSFGTAAGVVLTSMIWSMVALSLRKKAHGEDASPIQASDFKDPERLKKAALRAVGDLMSSPLDLLKEVTPILSEISYAAEHKKKYQMAQVTTPQTQALSALATCLPDLLDLSKHPGRMKQRACLESESYLLMPLPVNAWYKAQRWMQNLSRGGSADYLQSLDHLQTSEVDKIQKKAEDYAANPPKNADPNFVKGVAAIAQQLKPQTIDIPEKTTDAIRMAESGNDWSKPNGAYGFSKSQWSQISHAAPDLGLTENGRTAKDTSQQEKAIDWSLRDSATRLTDKDIPVNSQTLYGAHKLGVDTYSKVFNAPATEKISAVVGDLKNPEFEGLKTIGQLKAHLSGKLESAKKTINLTSNAPATED